MESKHIKGFAIFILCMVSVKLTLWLVLWTINSSAPYYHTPFKASTKLFLFFSCIIIILALTNIPHLGFCTNSNGFTADNSFYEKFGEMAYCQQHIVSYSDKTAEKEAPDNDNGQSDEQMKFIYSAEDAGDNARYSPSKSEKVPRCMDLIKYTDNYEEENCSVPLPELMQLVEVPAVIDSKNYNELASMIDEDFNRTVEEFIAKFNRQLRLQRRLPVSRHGLRL